jgi:signal transduction histidine kinase
VISLLGAEYAHGDGRRCRGFTAFEVRVRWGLVPRAVLASALIALLIAGAFTVLLLAIEDLRSSERQAVETRQALAAADNLERSVIDLETGQRGYVITGKERFLAPWRAARDAFATQAARLIRLAETPTQEAQARRIAEAIGAYIRGYSVPLVRAARRGDPNARSVAATQQGKDRVDALRAQFERLVSTERDLLTRRQETADDDAHRAIVLAAAGLAGSVILILVFGTYLVRSIVLPIRRTSTMAGRLAEGDLRVRLPETGAGEIGALERSFNRMGRSLEASHAELRQLAAAQAALRRVATLVARGVPPAELFDATAAEVRDLLGAHSTRLLRYESDGTATAVGGGKLQALPSAEERFDLEGENVAGKVLRTGLPARMETYEGAPGPLAAELLKAGIRSSVGAPVVVEDRLWGVMVAAWGHEHPPQDAEDRLAEFTELIATAIANAQSRAELAASRARVVAAGDEMRRRIKRDLHDGAQQGLVRTVITLKLARRALGSDEGEVAQLVEESLGHAEQANEDLRELAHGILPAVLTRGGLRAGVESLASRVPVPVSVDVLKQRFPPSLEATAYFITAEALTNVAKHAQARRAEVHAALEGGVLELMVRDDGVGGATAAGGSGLVGLKDRAEAAGGELRVESPPAGGTTIIAALPLRLDQRGGIGSDPSQ